MARYQKPNWFITKVANPAVRFLLGRVGLPIQGAQLLEVRGRKTGKPHAVPVNPVEVEGRRYLFAPRGETQWVRNFRAAGQGVLRHGSQDDPIELVRELQDAEKTPVMRAYLDRYHWQVASQVGVPKRASDEQLGEIAGNHPVFEIRSARRRG